MNLILPLVVLAVVAAYVYGRSRRPGVTIQLNDLEPGTTYVGRVVPDMLGRKHLYYATIDGRVYQVESDEPLEPGEVENRARMQAAFADWENESEPPDMAEGWTNII